MFVVAGIIKMSEVLERLKSLPGWSVEGNALQKTFEVADFVAAVDLVNKIVPIAEELEHHPDVTIRNYNRVTLSLTTHDTGGVTELDFALARRIEELISA